MDFCQFSKGIAPVSGTWRFRPAAQDQTSAGKGFSVPFLNQCSRFLRYKLLLTCSEPPVALKVFALITGSLKIQILSTKRIRERSFLCKLLLFLPYQEKPSIESNGIKHRSFHMGSFFKAISHASSSSVRFAHFLPVFPLCLREVWFRIWGF